MKPARTWLRVAGSITCVACWLASSAASAETAKRSAQAKPAAQAKQAKLRKVAVAHFDAPEDSGARSAVLSTLADHDDVEVVSLDDITFASQRIKADPKSAEGRRKVSEELGVDVWIDGRVDGDTAHLTLTRADGGKLEDTTVQAPTAKLLDALAGERMWQSMGVHLSPRESMRRRLLDETERARAKLEARAAEVERQRTLAKEATQRERAKAQQAVQEQKQKLEAMRARALEKRDARKALITKQVDIAQTRKAEELVARENLEAARKAEREQLAAQAASAKSRGAQQAVAQENTRASLSRAPTPIPGWSTAAGGAPTGRNGVSAATQRWLMQQQVNVAPNNYGQRPAAVQQPGYAANGGGISPATQRWLDQQQEYRATR